MAIDIEVYTLAAVVPFEDVYADGYGAVDDTDAVIFEHLVRVYTHGPDCAGMVNLGDEPGEDAGKPFTADWNGVKVRYLIMEDQIEGAFYIWQATI